MNLKNLIETVPEEIKDTLIPRSYPKGSHILRAGEENDFLYFLVQGIAEVYTLTLDGVMLSLNTYAATSFFGEYEVFNPKLTTAGVLAKTDCEILRIHKKDLHRWMQIDFNLTLHILEHFTMDVITSHQTNTRLAFLTIKERILNSIYSHYLIGDLPSLTKDILAQEVYAPIRSINRALSECAKEGIVRYEKKCFTVLNLKQLTAKVESMSR